MEESSVLVMVDISCFSGQWNGCLQGFMPFWFVGYRRAVHSGLLDEDPDLEQDTNLQEGFNFMRRCYCARQSH